MKKSPYGLEDKMDFGKYKGVMLIREIIQHDTGYITWLIKNTKFELDNEAYKIYRIYVEES